jgi:hypothetical protein
MFETLPSPSLEVVLIAARGLMLIGAFCVFALAFIRWRRQDERDAEHLRQQMERAFGELRSLHETVSVMSARIETLSELAEQGTRIAPAGPVSAQRGYELASRLARNGAGVEELVSTCGITRHEAELLVRLHAVKAREEAMTSAPKRPVIPQSRIDDEIAQAERAALTQPSPPSGRKRGSLLSVVG